MTRIVRLSIAVTALTVALAVPQSTGEATVPGAIGRIAFVSNADNSNWDIYVRDFGGSSPVRLTFDTDMDHSPVWSPDSTTIAFSRGGYGVHNVWVMNADGSNQTNITSGSGGPYNLAADWSPDGLWILALSNRSGALGLWKMRPDGTDPQMLFESDVYGTSAAWSPDGSRIAFARNSSSGGAAIWVMNADGSGAIQLTDGSSTEHNAAWSPDGSRIAYQSEETGLANVWVMNADGSHPVNLTNNPVSIWSDSPAWSPDGGKIAYTSDVDGDWDVWMMNPDGSGKAHLTDSPASEDDVSFESVDRDPIVFDDEVHVPRGGSVVIDVLGNDHDPDGEQLVVGGVTLMPNVGSAVINPDGTITYTHNNAAPPPGAGVYADRFGYEVQDTRMGLATGDVVIWIHPAFSDVPMSNILGADIIWLAEQGITRGCNPPDNRLFCPDAAVTRGQMAAFLHRALGDALAPGAAVEFVDDDGSVFEEDIEWLGVVGVTRGCNPPTNDMFCPEDVVTRGQMAAFLVRALDLPAGSGIDFVDDDGSIFEAYIEALAAADITRGCNPPTNDMFCPEDVVTRGQMAAFLHRALG